jgi:hypothetical protein
MELSDNFHAPAAVPQGKKKQNPLHSGHQNWSVRGGEREKSLPCPYRETKPGRPARSLVTIFIE